MNDEQRSAFTMAEFCRRNGISEGIFRKLIKAGRGPRLMFVGKSPRISVEAEAEWKHARENPGKQEQQLIARQRRERARIGRRGGAASAASRAKGRRTTSRP